MINVTHIGKFGRDGNLCEVLFDDDYLMTVKHSVDGYHVTGCIADASSAYSQFWDTDDIHVVAAIAAARCYV